MFWHGSETATAYDIYKLYLDLPVFIHKQRHSRASASSKANQKAKRRKKFGDCRPASGGGER